jgi:hypothetical protein
MPAVTKKHPRPLAIKVRGGTKPGGEKKRTKGGGRRDREEKKISIVISLSSLSLRRWKCH